MRHLNSFLLGTVLLLNAGCAYHFTNLSRRMPGGAKKIFVPVFKNYTSETGIETFFTNALIREIERASIARVVTREDSEATLVGTIQNVQYVSAGTSTFVSGQKLPTGTSLNTGYNITITMNISVVRTEDKAQLWERTVVGAGSYAAPSLSLEGLNSSNALYNQSTRMQAIEGLARSVMLETFNQMSETF